MESGNSVKSVKKAMDLLDHVVERTLHGEPASLAELAGKLGIPTNSARNLLKTLVDCGYVEQAGHGLYSLGCKCRQLGLLNRLEMPATRDAVAAVLQEFVAQTSEASVLAALIRGERLVAARVDSNQAVGVSHARIEDTPFFALPTGRMLAAMADERQLRDIIDRHGLPGRHWDNISSRPALAKAIDALRNDGICRIINEQSGLFAMACPVPSTAGDLPAVVGTFAPLFRCPPPRRKTLAENLLHAANALAGVLPQAAESH